MSLILLDAEQQRRFIPQVEVLRPPSPAEHVSTPHPYVLTLPSASPRLSLSPEAVAYYQRRLDLAQLAARAACHRVGTPDQADVIINNPCLLAGYAPLPGETGWMLPVEHVPYWFRITMRPHASYADLEYALMSREPRFTIVDPAWAAVFTSYVVLASGGRFAVQQETTYMVPDWLAIYAHAYVLATSVA